MAASTEDDGDLLEEDFYTFLNLPRNVRVSKQQIFNILNISILLNINWHPSFVQKFLQVCLPFLLKPGCLCHNIIYIYIII